MPSMRRRIAPASARAGIIAEVTLESLPQCLLQSYILITVMGHVNAHSESAAEQRLLEIGHTEILPRSITISTITMLKTWIELVHSAREAGISVRTKAAHLWHVGHGLPLEALKKGSITEWSCAYRVADGEVTPLLDASLACTPEPCATYSRMSSRARMHASSQVMPLLDALIKNSSLRRLSLSEAAIEWGGASASKHRSGEKLIEAMVLSATACANLQHFVVSPGASAFEIPVGSLRRGGGDALDALREMSFLDADANGPRRVEIELMADLLRTNRRTAGASAALIEESASAVTSLLEEARRGQLDQRRWQDRVSALMVNGGTRRSHFKSLLAPRTLREVGFSARALMTADFAPSELYEGGYTAIELKALGGFSDRALFELGYGVGELKAAGLGAASLAKLGHSAIELHGVGFTATELRRAGYPLASLVEAGYAPSALVDAGYGAAALFTAGFEAASLRASSSSSSGGPPQGGAPSRESTRGAKEPPLPPSTGPPPFLFNAAELRSAGYSAVALREAGYDCKPVAAAGYSAADATAAGYSLSVLLQADYAVRDLRKAGHSSSEMRRAGVSLDRLKSGGYTPTELQEGGFDAVALKGAGGFSLAQLREANTPVATLKEVS